MDAKELRIGNLVKSNGFYDRNGVVELKGITTNEKYLETISGIPLTSEWLEMAGAKKLQYNQRIYYNLDIIPVDDDGGLVLSYWFLPDGKLEAVWLVSEELEYDNSIQDERSWDYTDKLGMVHQLQNFYYSHKGEELELKEVSHSSKES